MTSQPSRAPVRPLLKWAGGKRQLLPVLRRFYPQAFDRYLEPFVGSAAVFFDLHSAGRLAACDVCLSDTSTDLIGCYQAVRDTPRSVIRALRALEVGHREGGTPHYYEVRQRFNRRRASRASINGQTRYGSSLAAMLIYLNRTGYNGLFRLSASGEFNVPAGRYFRPTICDPAHVRAVSEALQRVALRVCSFDEGVGGARAGDFVYFDPPYAALSRTSAFGAYTTRRFTDRDQERLRDVVVALARRGCAVLVSNSSAGSIEALYRGAAAAPGSNLSLWKLPARRAINSRPTARGPVDELLLTNLDPLPQPETASRLAAAGAR